MACETIQAEIDALTLEKRGLQQDLRDAAPSGKPHIANQIRRVNGQILVKKGELYRCQVEHGIPVFLRTTLKGRVRLTTSAAGEAAGPFTENVKLSVTFNAQRTSIDVSAFPQIESDPMDTPLGENVTTVTAFPERGRFRKSTGRIVIPVTLFFDQSVEVPFEVDSTLDVELETGNVGSLDGRPLDRDTRELRLVGAGRFKDGCLDGETGEVVLDGKLKDLP
jgi:hypothetical protein